MNKVFNLLTILLLSLLFSGCSSFFGKSCFKAEIHNKNANKGDSVVILFYELSDDDRFFKTSLESFLKSDLDALEGQMISREELRLLPKVSTSSFELKGLQTDTKYIGVVVKFREPRTWRKVIPVNRSGCISITIPPKVKVSIEVTEKDFEIKTFD